MIYAARFPDCLFESTANDVKATKSVLDSTDRLAKKTDSSCHVESDGVRQRLVARLRWWCHNISGYHELWHVLVISRLPFLCAAPDAKLQWKTFVAEMTTILPCR